MPRLPVRLLTTVAVSAAVLAGGGVAFAGATGTSGAATVTVCATSKTGALRIVPTAATCKAGEKKVSWNKEGPVGATGKTGAKGDKGLTGDKGDKGLTGDKGDKGDTGPMGPGMVSFEFSTGPQFSGLIRDIGHNMMIVGDCGDTYVGVRIYFSDQRQAWGTKTVNGEIVPVDVNDPDSGNVGAESDPSNAADLNLDARSTPGDPFTHVTMHSEHSADGCTYWGTVTASS